MIIGSNVVILTLLTHLTFTNEANCAGGVTGSCCCLALRLLSFVFDANCLPPGTRRGRGHSAWMTWNYCLESKEAWDHRQVREARGLGEGRMKLQSLEALPPPCPQGWARSGSRFSAVSASSFLNTSGVLLVEPFPQGGRVPPPLPVNVWD